MIGVGFVFKSFFSSPLYNLIGCVVKKKVTDDCTVRHTDTFVYSYVCMACPLKDLKE